MKPRTQIELSATANFGSTLDGWAVEHQYKLKQEQDGPEGAVRLYQKGTGLLVAPMMLRVVAAGERIRMEAWVRSGFFVRLMSLFILPAEMAVESGGFRGVLPRKIARTAINALLTRLSANPIP